MDCSRDRFKHKVEKLKLRFLNHSGWLENEREKLMEKHGSKLLEERLRSCKDKCRCNPTRSFSAKQVLEATNYFQSNCFKDSESKWYKCTLDDRPVIIYKYDNLSAPVTLDESYRDIVISSQMSSHRNALKLLGCCLEFSSPALVYEDTGVAPLGTMALSDFRGLSQSWNMRLKTAKEIAYAITYLHTAFSRPIIHRDIKPSNIFLDKDCVPKLCGFHLSISIPEGKTHVDDIVVGTVGYIDPVYLRKNTVTEHSDVYSFGVLLLVLIIGKLPSDESFQRDGKTICSYAINLFEKDRFKEIVDPTILEEDGGTNEVKALQLQAFLKLALSCTKVNRDERPLMIDVAKELVKIEGSIH